MGGGSGSGLTCTSVVVDDYVPEDGGTAIARAVAVAPNGNIYVVGWVGNPRHTVVRMELDAGTWQTIDDFSSGASGGDLAAAITVDSAGNVFVAGFSLAATGVPALVRRMSAGASTFATLSFPTTYANTYLANVAPIPGGVIAIGHSSPSDSLRAWRSWNLGTTWTEDQSGTIPLTTNLGFTTPAGEVFAAGYAGTSWKVMIGALDGGWWPSEQVAGGTQARAGGAILDGGVYVMGDNATTRHWEAHHRESDGGWTVVDDFIPVGAGPGQTYAFASFNGGVAYGGGCYANSACSSVPWTVRASRDGVTWNTVEQWDAGAGQASIVFGLAGEPNGGVLAVGTTMAPGNLYRWIVKRMTCN